MDFQNSLELQDHQSIRNYLASRKEAVTAELAAIRDYKEKLEEECEFWRGREESFKREYSFARAETSEHQQLAQCIDQISNKKSKATAATTKMIPFSILQSGIYLLATLQYIFRMQDDSSITSSGGKSKVLRTQSSLTDSFRMAASVLQGGSGPSKRALNLVIKTLRLKDKQEYRKQQQCQVCFIQFGRFGQHHCRICANAVCSSCSYSTINKQRACDKCAYHYSDLDRQVFKTQTLNQLTNLCVEFLAVKMNAEEQLKNLEAEVPKEEERVKEKKAMEEKSKKQNEKLEQLARDRKRLEEEIERIKNS